MGAQPVKINTRPISAVDPEYNPNATNMALRPIDFIASHVTANYPPSYDPRQCSRCIFTTVDPDTGFLMNNMQPLRLLRTYHIAPKEKLRDFYGESPIFDVYMIVKKEGRINVEDIVFVQKITILI